MVRTTIAFTSIREVRVKTDEVEIELWGGLVDLRPDPQKSTAIRADEYTSARLTDDFFPVIRIKKGSQAHRRLIKQFNGDKI